MTEEIQEIMKDLKERTARGADGVSGYTLKVCRQLIRHDIIEGSLKMEKVLREWKKS